MAGYAWSADEIQALNGRMAWEDFHTAHPGRTFHAWRHKRSELGIDGSTKIPTNVATREPVFLSDKKTGSFSWRDANKVIKSVQDLKQTASSSQDEADIVFDTDGPLPFICLSDVHIGSIATDHDLLERITDQILSTPNLHIALIGDLLNLAIKMKRVMEVKGDVLDADLQHLYLESWLDEIAHRVLFASWGNHDNMRQEDQAGNSQYASIMKKRVIWHNHIGHPNIVVGDQRYTIAASHFFRGSSYLNPCHGQMRYVREEGHDREIVIAGHTHTPHIASGYLGNAWRLYVNTGALQLESGYAKRFFSLFSHDDFPVVELWPDRHVFTAHRNVAEWARSSRFSLP